MLSQANITKKIKPTAGIPPLIASSPAVGLLERRKEMNRAITTEFRVFDAGHRPDKSVGVVE